jgi:hypothetical protein
MVVTVLIVVVGVVVALKVVVLVFGWGGGSRSIMFPGGGADDEDGAGDADGTNNGSDGLEGPNIGGLDGSDGVDSELAVRFPSTTTLGCFSLPSCAVDCTDAAGGADDVDCTDDDASLALLRGGCEGGRKVLAGLSEEPDTETDVDCGDHADDADDSDSTDGAEIFWDALLPASCSLVPRRLNARVFLTSFGMLGNRA